MPEAPLSAGLAAAPLAVIPACMVLAVLALLALALLARSGRRVLAALWLAPSLGVFVAGQAATWSLADDARVVLGGLAPERLVAAGLLTRAELLRTDALALLATAFALVCTACIAALGHASGAGPRARRTWLHAALLGTLGLFGAAATAGFGVALAAHGAALTLSGGLLVGHLALAAISASRGAAAADDRRLGGARGLVAACVALALVAMTFGVVELEEATRLARLAALPLDDRPSVVLSALEAARATLGLGALGLAVTGLSGLLAVLLVPRTLGSWRAMLGGLLVLVVATGSAAIRVGRGLAEADLAAVTTGGAVGRQPDVRLADLPRPRDLAGRALVDEGIVGTCLVFEGGGGWTGEPLHRVLDQRAAILAHGTPDRPVPALEQEPGCPDEAAPLDGPLSTHEVPVVVVPGNRLAPAVTGHRWFLGQGTIRLLLGPESDLVADEPRPAAAWRYRSLPLRWEMPPEGDRFGDGDGRWDYETASQLPVTVMEGRQPVLIAGGSRDVLPPGAEGVEQLRDAVLGSETRELVIVPRKRWTVQDVVDLCLSVHDRVEGTVCVVRPETPDGWSERTGLPLPWAPPPE